MATFSAPGKSKLARYLRGWQRSPVKKPVIPATAKITSRALDSRALFSSRTYKPEFLIVDGTNIADGTPVAFTSKTRVGNGWYGTIQDNPSLESRGFQDQTWVFDFTTGESVYGRILEKTNDSAGSRTVRINITSSSLMELLVGRPDGSWSGVNVSLPFTLQLHTRYLMAVRNTAASNGVQNNYRRVFINGFAGTEYESSSTDVDTAFKDTTDNWNIGLSNLIVHSFGFFRAALSNDACLDITRRYYHALTEPANQSPFLISVPAGGGVPTLSTPGVTGVQATQATPQVTLTF